MKASKIIENLRITGVSSDGKGVGRHDGRVIFVQGAAPGDLLDVRIIGKQKKIPVAAIDKIVEPSSDRVESFCEHFGTCGGCKWQHLSYEAQLRHKAGHVQDNMAKIAKADLPKPEPILGSKDTTYYRNKLEYTFSNMKWLTREEIQNSEELDRNALGFHIPGRFDKILDIEHCWLQQDPSNDIRLKLKAYAKQKGYSFFDLRTQEGFLRNLIIRTSSTGETMVIVQFFYDDQPAILDVMHYLKETFPSVTTLLYIVNPKGNETFYDLHVHTFSGPGFIKEEMEGLEFRISPKSFYQTNSKQAYELYKVARSFAGLTGHELVYDLYTGTGTIANFVAKGAKQVIGIESVEQAVADARLNGELNGITNTTFLAGDMKDIISDAFIQKYGKPDVIITDPPRAGMHTKVVETLLNAECPKIVYVSCNPATQARDIEMLSDKYKVVKIQPVDMFPHTQHIENVCLLELREEIILGNQ